MKFPVRSALPHIRRNNDAHLTRPSSTYKSGKAVQTSGATSAQGGGRVEPAADPHEAEMPDCACLHHERERGSALGVNGAAFGLQQVLYDSLCLHGRTPSQFGRYE